MEFCKKVAKGFKKVDVNRIDAGALKEAQVLDKKIRAARSELRKQILSIFLPILPTYVAGVFLRVCIRSVHGFVWGYEAQIEAAAAADNPDRNACFSMMFVWFVLVTVLQPFENPRWYAREKGEQQVRITASKGRARVPSVAGPRLF